VDRTARAIYEKLQKNPAALTALRSIKILVDGGAIGLALVSGGISWHDFILVPLAASLTHQLAEIFGKQYVDALREMTRQRQGELLSQHLSGPLAEYLTRWPATGGSEFERLQLALQRVPAAIAQLTSIVQLQLQNTPVDALPIAPAAVAITAVPIPGERS
jgi:hypothetical protein